MKALIEKLAIGNVDYEVPKAQISHNSFDMVLAKGEIAYGSFNIRSESNMNIKGVVYSSDYHLKLKNDQFLGKDNTIRFEANTEHLYPGDDVSGKIDIVSNTGEFSVNFNIHVKEENIESSMGPINNLEDFTKLVQYSHEEAIKLFMSREFKHNIIGQDVYTRALYNELMKNYNKEIAMEEFLVKKGLKEPVTISIVDNEKTYEDIKESYADSLKITKSGWGYVDIKVEINGEILHNCKNEINLDNFIGNTCEYEYLINPFKLHRGSNYAEIVLKTVNQTLTYKIHVNNPTEDISKYIENKKDIIDVMRLYMNFRTGKINSLDWKKSTEDIAEKRLHYNNEDIMALLIKTQLTILDGEEEQITSYLMQLSKLVSVSKTNNKLKSVEAYCYYLYLKTIYKQNATYTEEVRKEIKNYYENGYDSWKLLWMLMYMDDRYDQNPSLKYTLVKDQFNKGCTSPVMLYEAAKIISKQPELLRVINKFELLLLRFINKYDMYNDNLNKQIVTLFEKEKQFDKIKFEILADLYEKTEDVKVLEGICQMLVSGDKKKQFYFKWYDAGVKHDVKVTKLYEYYMYTIDTTKMFKLYPQIYKYFAFTTETLAYNKAYLYQNIIKYFDQASEMYKKYKAGLEKYVEEEIINKHIDNNLIELYKKMLTPHFVNNRMTKSLPSILNAWRITVDNPNITEVIIYHKELDEPQQVHLNGGEAFVEIYTDNPVIIFVDKDRNKYVNIEYTCRKILRNVKISEVDNGSIYLKLAKIEKNIKKSANVDILQMLKDMLNVENIRGTYRKYLLNEIVSYYYKNSYLDEYDDYVMEMNMNELDKDSRNKIMSILIANKKYKSVYPYILEYGPERLSDESVEEFCTGIIKETEFEEDAFILEMCVKLFRMNKVTRVILAYLGRFFLGTNEEMFMLYEEINKKNIIENTLTERLLVQCIFEGDVSERIHGIFNKYVQNPSYATIRKAFYTYVSYNYFVKNIPCPDSTWDIMQQDIKDGTEVTVISKIGYLSHVIESEHVTQEQIETSKKLMSQLAKKNIVFEFYKKFNKWFAVPYNIVDKTIIDYRTNPKNKVYITYKIKSITGETKEKTEEMRSVYSGIFTKDVIMFFGEEIEYYFEEISETDSIETKKYTMKINQKDIFNDEGRFGMLNGMMICKELHRDKDARELMETYELHTDASEQLFKLL